jgi:hypothetical protein
MNPTDADGNLPGTITFCPWYLDYERRKKYGLLSDAMLKDIGGKIAKLRTGKWYIELGKRTEIDYLSLFDTTVIHEVSFSLPLPLQSSGGIVFSH